MHWIYLIHEFHNLSWITEINELFHNILIYSDAPVYTAFDWIYKNNFRFKKCFNIASTTDEHVNFDLNYSLTMYYYIFGRLLSFKHIKMHKFMLLLI